jgi:dUTP pyrophosphatase
MENEFKLEDLNSKLIETYGKYMNLIIYLKRSDEDLINKYNEVSYLHNKKLYENIDFIDAGFDLYVPSKFIFNNKQVNKLNFGIVCEANIISKCNNGEFKTFNTGYYMYPRSSISKSNLRLANNVGIIDAGYRGNLIGMFDVIYDEEVIVNKFERYLQIVAPNMIPICVEVIVVDNYDEVVIKTQRGDGGFGSTGK